MIELLEKILKDGLLEKISDIHFEPLEAGLRIRFRKDGFLYQYLNLEDASLGEKIISRIKVLSDLNIAEKRLPQDGRFSFENIDFRVSTCPSQWGEKIVLRLQENKKKSLGLENLGLNQKNLNLLRKSLNRSQGMIIVTGPTGSGKTLSLYSALEVLNSVKKNICTVEDPIEINLPGIIQVNIQPKIGLDFARVLSAFLRQDPDVIMLGEIRDLETAQIAVRAAQTGHLVLTTLHTNSALESLTRLSGMGVKNYEVASSIILLIAQRLIRKLCEICKQEDELGLLKLENFLESFGKLEILKKIENIKNLKIFKARSELQSCEFCKEGFKGRIACFEVIEMDDDLQELILKNASILELKKYTESRGVMSLLEAGIEKILEGVTTLEEVLGGIL